MIPSRRIPSHPGRVLKSEYLEPLDMCVADFAAHLGVPEEQVAALVREEAPVTPQLAWLIGMATGTGPELWMNLQASHDLARNRPKQTLAKLVG